ncbi:MAG: hypothetical protein M3R15_07385 [Acidobacteriota bacterium]|nr:hypothetical protein [Acidobacteriota bacterium]
MPSPLLYQDRVTYYTTPGIQSSSPPSANVAQNAARVGDGARASARGILAEENADRAYFLRV